MRAVHSCLVTIDPIYKHIGALIKERRKTLGMKQEALASLLQISRGSVANIEIGRQNVLVHQLYKIASALQLSPFDLLPAPPSDQFKGDRTDLPLPSDLKAQQKNQVAQFFEQVDITKLRNHGASHVKATKL